MRKTMLYNQYYEKLGEFKTAVIRFFDDLSQHKTKLTTWLTHNFQIVGVA